MSTTPTHLQEVPRWVQKTAQMILKLAGWQVRGDLSRFPKAVIIAAPHTTNWDGPMAFLTGFSTGARFRWIGKKALFLFPYAWVSYLLGGIPVDRKSRQNAVEQMVEQFEQNKTLFIIIAPEGTRHYAPHWKSGFYHIALGAKVPIVMARINYREKWVDMTEYFYPSGDIHADMDIIRAAYQNLWGKNHDQFGPIRLESEPKQ